MGHLKNELFKVGRDENRLGTGWFSGFKQEYAQKVISLLKILIRKIIFENQILGAQNGLKNQVF